jgi:uncharacterized membrane protein YqjE
VARDILKLEVDYQQWQVVYRKAVQLGRALRGDAQLLEASAGHEPEHSSEDHMRDNQREIHLRSRPLAAVPTRELMERAVRQVGELSKKQLELARTEVRADVQGEIAMVKGLGIAAVCSIIAVTLLLVAAAFALAETFPPWATAATAAGALLLVAAICGIRGWSKRIKTPLAKTRKTLKEDVRWIKNRMA